MAEGFDRIAVGIGAAIAVVLQLVLAPNIALFGAIPNFMAAYAVVVALVRASACGVVLPFVLGMVFDVAGGGPIGCMALLLIVATLVLSRAFAVLNNDTLFMPVALIVLGSLLVEVLYGVLLMATGVDVGVLDALAFRALPCAAYDCVLGLLMFPLAARFLAQRGVAQPGSPLLG